MPTLQKNPLVLWNEINKFLKEKGVITKMLKDKKELQKHLIKILHDVQYNKDKIEKIKEGMSKYEVDTGDTVKYIDHAKEEIPKIDDLRILCLLTEQVYLASGIPDIRTEEYFTDVEIKTAKQYISTEDTLEKLPYIFRNKVIKLDEENYLTTIDIQDIKLLMNSNLLRYNFETQRDAKDVKRKVDRKDKIQKVANVNMKSVKEISEHLLKGTLMPTMITFNCLVGTSNNGDEIIYDSKRMELTVSEGTFIDILDGFHRITGVLHALEVNPDLQFEMQLSIKNYTTRTAQLYVAQINTVNKMSESRLKELKEARYSDQIVKQLQRESALKGISQSDRPSYEMEQYVSFSTISDAIDEIFNIESKRDSMKVGEYLTEFFDYLISGYPEAFETNIKEVNKVSIINSNTIFYGYILLAKTMMEKGISITKLDNILDNIDFSRENPEWKKIGILDENKRITARTKKGIKEYFSNIKI